LPFYHGSTTGTEAQQLLTPLGAAGVGVFLIRQSSKNPGDLVISFGKEVEAATGALRCMHVLLSRAARQAGASPSDPDTWMAEGSATPAQSIKSLLASYSTAYREPFPRPDLADAVAPLNGVSHSPARWIAQHVPSLPPPSSARLLAALDAAHVRQIEDCALWSAQDFVDAGFSRNDGSLSDADAAMDADTLSAVVAALDAAFAEDRADLGYMIEYAMDVDPESTRPSVAGALRTQDKEELDLMSRLAALDAAMGDVSTPGTSNTLAVPVMSPTLRASADPRMGWWFLSVSRDEATRLLEPCAIGIFLVRPSSRPGALALCFVRPEGTVGHGLLHERPGNGGWSIEGEANVFDTLDALLRGYPGLDYEATSTWISQLRAERPLLVARSLALVAPDPQRSCVCTHCGNQYENERLLEKHRALRHPGRRNSSAEFDTADTVSSTDALSSAPANEWCCPVCGNVYDSEETMWTHHQVRHEGATHFDDEGSEDDEEGLVIDVETLDDRAVSRKGGQTRSEATGAPSPQQEQETDQTDPVGEVENARAVWKQQRERLQQVKQEDERKRQVAMLLLEERKRAIVAGAASKKNRNNVVVSAPVDVKHKPASQILQELGADPQLIALMTAKQSPRSELSPTGDATSTTASVPPVSALTSSDPLARSESSSMLSPKALKLLGIDDESKMNKKGVQPTVQRVASAVANKLSRRSTAPAAVPDRSSDDVVNDVLTSLNDPTGGADDEASSDMAKILAADTLRFTAVAGSSAPSQYQMLPPTSPLPGVTPNNNNNNNNNNYAPLSGLPGAVGTSLPPNANYAPLGTSQSVVPTGNAAGGGDYGVIAGFGDTRTALPSLPPVDVSNYQSVANFGQPQLPGMPGAPQGYGELPEGMQGKK